MKFVDFHTHILPAIDDGSSSVEESIAMLKEEKLQGTEIVVATPHFYPHHDRPERFLSRRKAAYDKLMEKIDAADNLPQIIQAAEVYYFKGIGQWDGLADFAIENTSFVLLEMPMEKWTERMYDDILDIYRIQGLTPVIAHIDRYINRFNARRILDTLGEMPVMIQANAGFFTDRTTRKLALKLLKNNDINILGSDCHNMTERMPNLRSAGEIIEQQLGGEYITNINRAENRILHDLIKVKL